MWPAGPVDRAHVVLQGMRSGGRRRLRWPSSQQTLPELPRDPASPAGRSEGRAPEEAGSDGRAPEEAGGERVARRWTPALRPPYRGEPWPTKFLAKAIQAEAMIRDGVEQPAASAELYALFASTLRMLHGNCIALAWQLQDPGSSKSSLWAFL